MIEVDQRSSIGVRAAPTELGEIGSIARARLNTELLSLLRRHLGPSPIQVLDVGCGSGVLALQLRSLGTCGRYVGCDLARHPAWATIESEQSDLEAAFALVGAEKVGSLGRRFDLVVSIMAFEHLEEDLTAIREIARTLAPGAVVVLAVPAPASRFYLGSRHCYRWYDAERIALLAHEAKLELREVVVQRSGVGLVLDSFRQLTFVGASRAVRAVAYALAGGRKDVAKRRFPRAVEFKPILNVLWNRTWSGRLAHWFVAVGLAGDRVLAPIVTSYIVVLAAPVPRSVSA